MKYSAFALLLLALDPLARAADKPLEIRSRLELFVDDWLVERFEGDAALHLHEPLGKEVVLMNDKPWEDTSLGYVSSSVGMAESTFAPTNGKANWEPTLA